MTFRKFIRKFNRIIRKISIPLNIINVVIGMLLGIGHVYIPVTSLFGLILGCFMATSGSVSIGISYYFTTKKTEEKEDDDEVEKDPAKRPKNNKRSNLFLAIAIPCLLLNTAASFFGMYTGILLLAAAIALPIAPWLIAALAIVFAIILAASTLINSWLQTYHIWESLRQPKMEETPKEEETDTPTLQKTNRAMNELNLTSCPKITFPPLSACRLFKPQLQLPNTGSGKQLKRSVSMPEANARNFTM